MKKSATAYKRGNAVFVHSNSQTTAGIWIAGPPYLKVAFENPPDVIGNAVTEALNASKESVPHPKQDEWGRIFSPMLELAGTRSLGKFEQGALCCGLETEGEQLVITPHQKGPSGKGFQPILGEEITVNAISPPHEIGNALKEAFCHCR